jgi:hypothetical protein
LTKSAKKRTTRRVESAVYYRRPKRESQENNDAAGEKETENKENAPFSRNLSKLGKLGG